MKHLLPLFAFLLCGCAASTEDFGAPMDVNIIPKPEEVKELGYNIKIGTKTTIFLHESGPEAEQVASYLKKQIEGSVIGAQIDISNEVSNKDGIHLRINRHPMRVLGDEGYVLNTEKRIEIKANKGAGLFYGVQTLLQLLPPAVYSKTATNFELLLPAVVIHDQPRYEYRGMHLDPCRHFFSVDFTKKYLDYMAYHKLNKFHWHLTEDQGWRIEIKKHPRLIEIGSKRSGTMILSHDVAWKEQQYDTIPVEGYYSHEDIREIVAYAAERHIEVIPEIEMPGHSTAALASYPNLSCTGGPFKVLQRPGVIEDVYCAGNDSVFAFLKDVIDEVVTLFPSQYIHIGGDECPKERWKECPKCQARIANENLKDEKHLQSWFITEMEKYINAKGKTIIGWSEIMEGGIAPNAVLESWKGVEAGVEAAKNGHKAIMSPYQYIYFDGIYVDRAHALMEPFGQKYCWTNTEKAYSFEPTPDTIPVEYHQYFIGAEGAMWTEFIKTESHLEYMLLPRLSALSEVCWTAKHLKNFEDFSSRLNTQYQRFEALDAHYRIPNPVLSDTILVKKGGSIPFEKPGNFTVRYTTDGTEPNNTSPVLDSTALIHSNGVLKARAYNSKGRGSSISSAQLLLKE